MMKLAAIVDRIEEKAAGYSPRRAAVTVLALPFIVAAAAVAVVLRLVWRVGTWVAAALVVGLQVGRAPSGDEWRQMARGRR